MGFGRLGLLRMVGRAEATCSSGEASQKSGVVVIDDLCLMRSDIRVSTGYWIVLLVRVVFSRRRWGDDCPSESNTIK